MIGTAPLKPTHETNIRELKFIFLKWQQTDQDTQRACKNNHEYTNEEGREQQYSAFHED